MDTFVQMEFFNLIRILKVIKPIRKYFLLSDCKVEIAPLKKPHGSQSWWNRPAVLANLEAGAGG